MKPGLAGMIRDLVERTVQARRPSVLPEHVSHDDPLSIAQMLGPGRRCRRHGPARDLAQGMAHGVGQGAGHCITGTGGAGKSSVTDEIVALLSVPAHLQIAVLAVDPTRRRTGGALLGDRIA